MAIPKGAILGEIATIAKVFQTEQGDLNNPKKSASPQSILPEDSDTPWHPSVNLTQLKSNEQTIVIQLIYKEPAVFVHNDTDIGNIINLQMTLSLKYDIPVQKAYTSISKSFLKEVKEYVQDLLAKGWIVKSHSPYAAPVVSARETVHYVYVLTTGSSIRNLFQIAILCQESMKTLGGYRWFSILDQGKAYHQGFMAEGSRHLTGFVTPWGLFEWVRIPFGQSNAPAP